MASRRRFRRGFGRKPVMRERLIWNTNVFEEIGVSGTGALVENALYDPLLEAEMNTATGSGGGHVVQIRRIILTGGIVFSPSSTALEFDVNALWSAIYVIDREETDADLTVSGIGALLEGGARRVLWAKCFPFANTEQASTLSHQSLREPIARFDEDLKVRVNLAADEQLVHGFQLSNDVSSSMADIRCFALSRVLLRKNV